MSAKSTCAGLLIKNYFQRQLTTNYYHFRLVQFTLPLSPFTHPHPLPSSPSRPPHPAPPLIPFNNSTSLSHLEHHNQHFSNSIKLSSISFRYLPRLIASVIVDGLSSFRKSASSKFKIFLNFSRISRWTLQT